jgi:hypothetical protein
MNRKYLVAGLIGFTFILGWNAFLIKRDAKLFEAYNQPIQQQK